MNSPINKPRKEGHSIFIELIPNQGLTSTDRVRHLVPQTNLRLFQREYYPCETSNCWPILYKKFYFVTFTSHLKSNWPFLLINNCFYHLWTTTLETDGNSFTLLHTRTSVGRWICIYITMRRKIKVEWYSCQLCTHRKSMERLIF
jgi:hypothetical protein